MKVEMNQITDKKGSDGVISSSKYKHTFSL